MGQALTEREIEAVVREVTDEEVAFYHEYGWVMMKQLVDSAFATELLRVGQEWLKRNGEERGGRRAVGLARREETEPFRSFMFSERMSKNATRLVNRKRLKGVDIPLRYRIDILQHKPRGQPEPRIIRTRQSTALIAWASSSSGLRWWKCRQR